MQWLQPEKAQDHLHWSQVTLLTAGPQEEVSPENELSIGPVCPDDENKLPSIIRCQGSEKGETNQSGGEKHISDFKLSLLGWVGKKSQERWQNKSEIVQSKKEGRDSRCSTACTSED